MSNVANAFGEYYINANLATMEKLFEGYVYARLDQYLNILQES